MNDVANISFAEIENIFIFLNRTVVYVLLDDGVTNIIFHLHLYQTYQQHRHFIRVKIITYKRKKIDARVEVTRPIRSLVLF